MVTNYPQEIVTQPVTAAETAPAKAFSRVWRQVQSILCSLHGHDTLLHYDQNRIYLRCASCGHETPGWELDERRPRIRFRGDARRFLVAKAAAERPRRIA
ncbi:MAG: hypothetical protein ACM3NQ_05535 [Bacteroidales bacterium]